MPARSTSGFHRPGRHWRGGGVALQPCLDAVARRRLFSGAGRRSSLSLSGVGCTSPPRTTAVVIVRSLVLPCHPAPCLAVSCRPVWQNTGYRSSVRGICKYELVLPLESSLYVNSSDCYRYEVPVLVLLKMVLKMGLHDIALIILIVYTLGSVEGWGASAYFF